MCPLHQGLSGLVLGPNQHIYDFSHWVVPPPGWCKVITTRKTLFFPALSEKNTTAGEIAAKMAAERSQQPLFRWRPIEQPQVQDALRAPSRSTQLTGSTKRWVSAAAAEPKPAPTFLLYATASPGPSSCPPHTHYFIHRLTKTHPNIPLGIS